MAGVEVWGRQKFDKSLVRLGLHETNKMTQDYEPLPESECL